MLYRIQEALLCKPWLIKPSAHLSMVRQLDAYLSGVQLPTPPVPDPAEKTSPVTSQGAIQVISLSGTIGKHLSLMETDCGGYDLNQLNEELKAARDNPQVQKILINFDTPGGSVTGVPESAALIDSVSQVKPIFGFTETQCCSAGVFLGSQCTAFYCSPSSDVGSIGVWSLYMDQSAKLAKDGVIPNEISSGKFKTIGAPWRQMTAEEKAILKADSDKIYEQFKAAVISKRNVSEDVLQGLVYDGQTAVANGLADGLFNDFADFLSFFLH